MNEMHHIRILTPRGDPALSRVELDNQLLLGVVAVRYEINAASVATVTLQLIADVEIEGEAEIIKEWRSLLPKAESPASKLAHQGWNKLSPEERQARMAPVTAGRVRAARLKRMSSDTALTDD
jgi:hypothetical protein